MSTAQTTYGPVQGVQEDALHIFKGIPYAAPPVGERRWLPPAPPEPWSEARDARNFGAAAPQNPPAIELLAAFDVSANTNEDCLTLNVWTPGLDDAKRAVMIWIHGGAFIIGAGSQGLYEGSPLAAKGDVVVVTINYRLGALGFLNLKEVTKGRIPSTGNEGLLDQAAALKWVRDNIAAFGGDPGNVTIFGESAGGMSVGCQLALPGSRGLFHKAIPQSGGCHTANPKERMLRIAERFLFHLGIDGDSPDALRAVSSERLLEVQTAMSPVTDVDAALGGMPFQPCVDGEILQQLPIEAVRAGSAAGVPVLVGSTLDEWKLLGPSDPSIYALDTAGLRERVAGVLGENAGRVAEIYEKAVSQRGVEATPTEVFLALETDRVFRMPALQLAEAQRQHDTPVFNYLFTWPSPAMGGMLGSCHALELCFVFGTIDATNSRDFCGSGPECDALEEAVQESWLAFAKTGSPGNPTVGDWPHYADERETMILGASSRIEEAPYEAERLAWEGVEQVGTL